MSDGYQVNTEKIKFGPYRGTIYLRADVKDSSYFFRMYVAAEKRHFRKSLGTDDIRVARELATKEIVSILAKVETGQRIVAKSLGDLRREYLLVRTKLVGQGQISKNTLSNNATRIGHGMRFLESKGKDRMTRVNSLDGKLWDSYLDWRFEDATARETSVRRDVVRDELLMIRAMFEYAKTEKWCLEKSIPVWNFAVEKMAPKRRRMTANNYRDLINTVRAWQTEPPPLHEKDSYLRKLVRHVVLVISNCGMRSGEVFGLKNKDVEIRDKDNECLISIRAETSKVRYDRLITLNATWGGKTGKGTKINYLIRWMREHALHRSREDFLFARFEGGRRDVRGDYYDSYKKLRKALEPKSLEWFDTYHCRHFWLTNRLYAGEPIHLIAKSAGTSVSEIESTYSNVLSEMATKSFSKRAVEYDVDGSFKVVENLKPYKPRRKRRTTEAVLKVGGRSRVGESARKRLAKEKRSRD